jgi:hypothetical protein
MAARSVVVIFLLASAGCATSANNDAQEALRVAREADAKATQAAADAAAARAAADAAAADARAASERSDRMYQRTVQK